MELREDVMISWLWFLEVTPEPFEALSLIN